MDLGIPRVVVPSLIALLKTSYPLSTVTHSFLSPEQHGALISRCWDGLRCQLNGYKVLDVLEQQWGIGGTEAERQRRDIREVEEQQMGAVDRSPTTTPSSTPTNGRKRRREEEEVEEEGSEVFDVAGETDGQGEEERREGEELKEEDTEPPTLPPRSSRPSNPSSGRPPPGQAVDEGLYWSDDDVPLSSAPLPIFRLASAYERPARRSWDGNPNREQRFPALYRYCPLSDFRHYPNVLSEHQHIDLSLLLTSFDCFCPGLTFVFGVARLFKCAVVSTYRLTLQSPSATSAFLYKECVHEVGHLFGLHHCRLPCVMTYSSSVEEAHEKESHLCGQCKWKVGWMESGVNIQVIAQSLTQTPQGAQQRGIVHHQPPVRAVQTYRRTTTAARCTMRRSGRME